MKTAMQQFKPINYLQIPLSKRVARNPNKLVLFDYSDIRGTLHMTLHIQTTLEKQEYDVTQQESRCTGEVN